MQFLWKSFTFHAIIHLVLNYANDTANSQNAAIGQTVSAVVKVVGVAENNGNLS